MLQEIARDVEQIAVAFTAGTGNHIDQRGIRRGGRASDLPSAYLKVFALWSVFLDHSQLLSPKTTGSALRWSSHQAVAKREKVRVSPDC